MLPVKTGLVSIKESLVTGNHRFIGDDHHPRGIQAAADPLTDPVIRHRVAISSHADQTGAGDPHSAFDIAVKGNGHWHHSHPFQFQDVRHPQPVVLWVQQLVPEGTTALPEPDIQLFEGVGHAISEHRARYVAGCPGRSFRQCLSPSQRRRCRNWDQINSARTLRQTEY